MRRLNRSSFLLAPIIIFLFLIGVDSLFAQTAIGATNPRLAACYLRQLRPQEGGGTTLRQGSATLIKFRGMSGVYAITAYHVTQGMGGVSGAELFVPGAGGYPVSEPYYDTSLDTALLRVEKLAPELEARALDFDALSVAIALPKSDIVTYSDAQRGGAVAAAEKRFTAKEVLTLPVAVQLPVQQLSAPIFLRGAELKEGQSGALLFCDGQPAGLASANAKVNGKKGHLMAPFSKIKESLTLYEKDQKDRALAVSN